MRHYLRRLYTSYSSGSATELTYCQHLGELFSREMRHQQNENCSDLIIEAQPSQNGRFPDFIIVNTDYQTVVRIEAKPPTVSLDDIVTNNREQLIRYLSESIGHPNLIITNFLSFSFVVLQDGEPTLSGEIYELTSLENLQDTPQDDVVVDARVSFRQMLQDISNLEPVEVNSATRVHNSLSQLCNAVMDWHYAPDVNNQTNHERVIREAFIQLTRETLGGAAGQNDLGETFGQLVAVGYCMNEFLRQRNEVAFDEWQFSSEIFTNPSLSTLMTILHANRRMIGIENLDQQVRLGLSQHMGEISPDDDSLGQNMRIFESFLHDYLRLEDENWVNNYGLVPTPPEIVTYMVRKAEQEWINIDPDNRTHGYLEEECSVLDPCTGSGHYYIEVLRTIHARALAGGYGQQYASDIVRRAIGTDEFIGRIHAFDIQPMCVVITEMQLRLFCEDLGWDSTRGLRPQIFVQDALQAGGGLYQFENINNRRIAAVNPESPISITLGNPPWSAYTEAAAITDQIRQNLRLWTQPFQDWYEQNINSFGKSANYEIAYAFFRKYLTSNNHELVCFVSPDTLTWSSQWLGFRRWAVVNGLYIRIDNLGGSSGLIVRPDGEPLFLQNGVPRTTSASTVYTMYRQEESPTSILSRDCWDHEGGDSWETCQKLENLRLEAENIAGADIEYDSDYSNFIPPRSRWRPASESLDAPLLPEIARYDQNWSGMRSQNGGYRLVNSNATHLLSTLTEIFGHESIADCHDPEYIWYLEHLMGNEAKRTERFDWLRDRVDDFQQYMRQVTMSPMCNAHAFTPLNIVNGKDALKLWKILRVHENVLPEDHVEYANAQGYLCIMQRITGKTLNSLGPGFVVSHNQYYPGHNDTGSTNGRSYPRSVFDGENWIDNVSPRFIDFVNQHELDLGDSPADRIWDYLLCILSSNQMVEYSNPPLEPAYQAPVLVTNNNQLWNRICQTGSTIRLLQETVETLPAENPFSTLHGHVSQLLGNVLLRHSGQNPPPQADADLPQFRLCDLKQCGDHGARNWTPTENVNSVFANHEELVEAIGEQIQQISQAWGIEHDGDSVETVFSSSSSILLDHPNDIWLSGIPSIVTEFKLAGDQVLKKWLAYNSDLSQIGEYLHWQWDNTIRNDKWVEMITIIRNITTMALLRPIINQLYVRAEETSQSWDDFLNQ